MGVRFLTVTAGNGRKIADVFRRKAEELQRRFQLSNWVRFVEWRRERLFAELLAIFVYDHRHVAISWCRISEQLLKMYLAWRGIEQIGPADHIGNALIRVIDHNRKLVSEDAVGSE